MASLLAHIKRRLSLGNIIEGLIIQRLHNMGGITRKVNETPMGPLYDRFGSEVVFNLETSLQARVSSIIFQGDWR